MSIAEDFDKWRKEVIAAPPPDRLFSYVAAMKCLEDAERCVNAGYHVEFTEGIVEASQMLQNYVPEDYPNHITLIKAFAEQSVDMPDEAVSLFVPLITEMDQPHASGAKFVMAHLILMYGTLGIYPESGKLSENVTRNIGMLAGTNAILEHLKTLKKPLER